MITRVTSLFSAGLASSGLLMFGIGFSTMAAAQGSLPSTPVVVAPPDASKPPYSFEPDDVAFLDDVQRGCLNYFLHEIDPFTGMVLDRTGLDVISVAGVGFQLTALSIADHRGWLDHAEAEARVHKILRSLHANSSNRERGLFYHYLRPGSAGRSPDGYEDVVSTVDTALLFAGLITASAHFGDDVACLADQLVADGDWSSFVLENPSDTTVRGFISLAWQDQGGDDFQDGLLPFAWADAGDEQRLVTFLAAAAPVTQHRVNWDNYFRLRRTLGRDRDNNFVAWFPWSGALFTSFFSHMWIDYARQGTDDPASFDVPNRPGVDWWENSRRLAKYHRDLAIENPLNLPGIGQNVWGLSASDGQGGYLVPGLFPPIAAQQFGQIGIDHLRIEPADNWEDGTIAPYTAGSTIMFDPDPAIEALRQYRAFADDAPGLWASPETGGYGFADSFRLGVGGSPVWVAPDRVAIDAGPLMIAIENARSTFVWDTFRSHPFIEAAWDRRDAGPSAR